MLCSISIHAASDALGYVREEATVTVDGHAESWRLQWLAKPMQVCSPGDAFWITSPCNGFAYGESGPLDLIRTINGVVKEKLSLTPLFSAGEWDLPASGATVQLWPATWGDPYDSSTPVDLGPIKARGVVKIMNFRDYDHDGQSTEFLLHVGAMAGGRQLGMVIGVSHANPRLHAFGTVEHPNHPLVLQLFEWDRMLHTPKGQQITLTDWPCDDHGSRFRQDFTITTDAGGIHVKKQQFDCPSSGGTGKLIFEEIE